MSDKATKPKSNTQVVKQYLDGEEREYFIPSINRTIKAVDQADIENQVKEALEAEDGDGNS